MAQPDMNKVRKFHPENFDVNGANKTEGDVETRKEALEATIKNAKADLKELEATKNDEETTDTGVDASLTVAELKEIAQDKDIDLGDATTKAQIIEVINAQ